MVKEDLNIAIVRAVGLYRVATRATVATLLPEGVQPDKRLAKLVKDGFLRAHKGLPQNRSVYQLTKKGATLAELSPARGRVIGSQSLLKNLGILLFCHVEGTQRYRVETEELASALGTSLPDAAYCLCRHKEQAIIFECYVPGPQTPVQTVVWHLKKQLRAAKSIAAVGDAIKDLRYGFALIVPNHQRRKAIMDGVRTAAPGEKFPLIKRVRILVEAIEELGIFTGTASTGLRRTGDSAEQLALFPTE